MTDFPSLERSLHKPQSVRCETCGHEEVEQWHKLSGVHVRALVKLADAVESSRRAVTRYEAGIANDGSEYGNFAAMRWWNLIEQPETDRWTLTPLAWEFLACRRSVAQHVLTLRGEVKGYSVGLVDITKVADEDTWKKADFLANRHAHVPTGALVTQSLNL